MENTFKIGQVARPQGIKGQLKIVPLTDDITRFNKLKEVIIDQKTYRVTQAIIGGDSVIVALFGVSDRNTAEAFRGKYLCVTRENAVPLKKDNYFISDIIGCTAQTDSGKILGEVIDVTSAKTDIFTLKTEVGKIIRFPFLKDALVSVDIQAKLITLKEKRFSEIACYED